MERRSLIPLIFMLVLSACAGGGFQEPLASVRVETQTTYSPPQPTRVRLNEVEVDLIDGVSQISDLNLSVDGPAAKTSLQGVVTIRPINHGTPVIVPINVEGTISPDDLAAYMHPLNAAELERLGARVGAKMMCLSRDCSSSFVDIYVNYKGHFYHHQVESKNDEKSTETLGEKPNESSDEKDVKTKPRKPKKDPLPRDGGPRPQTPVKEPDQVEEEVAQKDSANVEDDKTAEEVDSEAEDEQAETETETEPEVEKGNYVGEPEKDVRILFPDVKPREKTPPPVADTDKDQNKDQIKDQNRDQDKNKSDNSGSKKEPQKDDRKEKIKDKKKDPKPEPKQSEPVKPAPAKPEVPVFPAVDKKNADQAIGFPFDKSGRLENSSNFLEFQNSLTNPGFRILYPNKKRYYGTSDLLSIMSIMGKFSVNNLDGYTLKVTSISAQKGGKISGQESHRNGLDADIGYYYKNPERYSNLGNAAVGSKVLPDWMPEEQWELFKHVVTTQNVDRIFVGPAIKKELCSVATKKGEMRNGQAEGVTLETLRVLVPWSGHNNHFHLRIKCSKAQPRCRQSAPPANVTGCR